MAVSRKLTMLIFLILAFGITSAATLAAAFNVNYQVVDNELREGYYDGTTYFNLTIENTGPKIVYYRFYTTDSIQWSVATDPSTGNIIKFYPNETKTLKLLVRALRKDMMRGNYKVPLVVRNKETDEKVDIQLPISIVSGTPLFREYVPEIEAFASIKQSKIDPREKTSVEVHLVNKNPRNITELNILLQSKLVNKKSTVQLGPFEEKIAKFIIDFDPLERPQIDTLTIRVWTIAENESFPKKQPVAIEYEILPYSELKREEVKIKKFLKSETKVTLSNVGNAVKEATVKMRTSDLKKLFTSSLPEAEFVTEGENKHFVWFVRLEPQKDDFTDSITLVIIENYRPIFFVLLLILIGIFGYYKFRNPIVIRKDTSQVITKEGGIVGLKVLIHLRNRTKRTLENIAVIDTVPSLVQVEKEFEIGTLPPTKITKQSNSMTSLHWDISDLEALEERIITYQIKSKLSLLGGMNLPAAVIKYTTERGKVMLIHSKKLTLNQ